MTKLSAARAKRLAEIYVFEHSGNQRASWRQLLEEEHVDYSETTINNAWREFQQPKVKEWITKFQESAQEQFDVRKTEIVSNLQNIAFDESNSNKDRLSALKQLTDIGGFATQKVDLNAKADIEVIIE